MPYTLWSHLNRKTNSKTFNTVYTDLEAQLHDVFWEKEDIISEIPLLEKFHDHKLSLEIGCGSGRLLLPLLENEHPIDGVEISSEMVTLLHQNAEKKALRSKLEQQDIHTTDILSLDLTKPYERVSIPAFTAQLFSRQQFQALLNQLHQQTIDEARLYLTLFIPWAEITGELREGEWYLDHQARIGDNKNTFAQCKTKFTINRLLQILSRRHHYTVTHPNGKKQQHRSSQDLQWYSYPEMQLLLEKADWTLTQLITDLDSEKAPDPDAHILTIIAEKQSCP